MRFFVYTFCMGQLLIYHVRCTVKVCKQGETVRVLGLLRVPEYLFNLQEYISLIQCIVLI